MELGRISRHGWVYTYFSLLEGGRWMSGNVNNVPEYIGVESSIKKTYDLTREKGSAHGGQSKRRTERLLSPPPRRERLWVTLLTVIR